MKEIVFEPIHTDDNDFFGDFISYFQQRVALAFGVPVEFLDVSQGRSSSRTASEMQSIMAKIYYYRCGGWIRNET